jgi:DHA2 family multidrug resistance protein
MTNYFVGQGSPLIEAQQQTTAWVGQQVQLQASFLAYMDAFWVLMLLALAAVPLALCLRKVKLGGAAPRRSLMSTHGSSPGKRANGKFVGDRSRHR